MSIGLKGLITLQNKINNLQKQSSVGGGDTWVVKPVTCREEDKGTPQEWINCSVSTDDERFIYTTDPTLGALAPGFINNFDLSGIPLVAGGYFYIELATFTADQVDCLTAFNGDITPQVHTFATTNILDTTAVLNWRGSGALWNVEYGQVGFTPGTGTLVSGIDEPFLQVTGLTDSTDYEFYVQGECGGSTSSFAGPSAPFTTLAALGTCDYTINMFDAYSDGWNGASIDVDVDGVVTNVGLPTGGSGTAFVPSLNGDNVTFTFNSGSYDNEVTFNISDPLGILLGSYGPSPTVGLFLTDTSSSTCT